MKSKTKRQEPRNTVAKDYAAYLEAYILYTTCPEEDEPEKSAIHHGTFKYHNHAGFVCSCFRNRSECGNAKSDCMIYNEMYND